MDDHALLRELAPVAGRMFERHLAASREWLPFELVPWERTHEPPLPIDSGVRSALIVNVLTEDALPYYTTALFLRFGSEGPWWDWSRRWTAEEMRHGMALHDYLNVTRAVDLAVLERSRVRYLSTAVVPTAVDAASALVYLAMQELATRIAHANTAKRLPDDAGRHLVSRIAADEQLHHVFYRDVVEAALALAPSDVVVAIDRQVRHFAMPGHDMPGFAGHALAIAAAGIYSASTFLEHVATPLVVGQWHLDELTELSAPAARARDRTLSFLARMGRIATRL